MRKFITAFLFLFVSLTVFSNKLVMYVEYGGKGIKLGVLEYTDASFRKYKPIDSKELNIGLSKSIQSTGKISKSDIDAAVSSSNDAYQFFLTKYESKGLTPRDVFFYTSSGLGVASNIDELCTAVKAKTGQSVYVVKDTEEAKYTIAGTIPYDKIEQAMVLDQGGSNTKGGYVVLNGNMLTAVPVVFDMGSVRISEHIMKFYMQSHPDDADQERIEYISAMNKCFDSLKVEIKNTLSNIDGAEDRNELYLSGGAAFVITTLLKPEAPLNTQMVEVSISELKAFSLDIQDRDFYNSVKNKKFQDETIQKNYSGALKVYNQLQLISATKLLLTYINALGGSDKKIYFNRYGLHSMPSMLIGRVLRNEIKRW